MTHEELIALQDLHLEWAKDIARKRGHISPVAFVVTTSAKARTAVRISGMTVKGVPAADKAEVALMTVMMHEDDWEYLYNALAQLWPTLFPDRPFVLAELLALGQKDHIDFPYMRVVRPFLHVTGMEARDVVCELVRFVARQCDAEAVICICEAWMRTMTEEEHEAGKTRADLPARLGDDAQATEHVVCTLDAGAPLARMVSSRILRRSTKKGRDAGKVLGFEDGEAVVDTTGHDLVGRMVRFVNIPAPGARAPRTPS